MNEKPILFSGEMVRAILEGRKTQTRRVSKDQGEGVFFEYVENNPTYPEYWNGKGSMPYTGWVVKYPNLGIYLPRLCPYGKVGDRLWVRETWNAMNGQGQWWHDVKVSKAARQLYNWAWTNPVQPALQEIPPRWLPSIHMPRAASRITLEIVNVRVERIQQINQNENDAIAEGVSSTRYASEALCARDAFMGLWDSINSQRGYGWDVNPWVWVIEFKVV